MSWDSPRTRALSTSGSHADYAQQTADGERVRVRIGPHAGEPIKDGGDFYGKNVILASRVASQAKGGEILVSSLLRQLVESSIDASTFSAPRSVVAPKARRRQNAGSRTVATSPLQP